MQRMRSLGAPIFRGFALAGKLGKFDQRLPWGNPKPKKIKNSVKVLNAKRMF